MFADILFSSHVIQLLEGILSPSSPMCLKNLHLEAFKRHPERCLITVPFNAKKQHFYSKLLLEVQAPDPVLEDEPRHQEGKPITAACNLNLHHVGRLSCQLTFCLQAYISLFCTNSPVWISHSLASLVKKIIPTASHVAANHQSTRWWSRSNEVNRTTIQS